MSVIPVVPHFAYSLPQAVRRLAEQYLHEFPTIRLEERFAPLTTKTESRGFGLHIDDFSGITLIDRQTENLYL